MLTLTLPSVDPVEIRDIVALQAEKHTPYTKEEILTDFRILDSDRGYSRVLLVLSHQDIVHRALRVVEGAGWPLERVGFELEGLVGWHGLAQTSPADGAVMVAEMDADTTTLVAVKGKAPYFHRSVAYGAEQLARDGADGPAKLLGEFQRSLEAFDAEGANLAVTGVVLTGCAERFPQLADQLHKGLDLPVSIASPLAGATVPEALAASVPKDVSFASLAGLAFAPSAIDLTPKALRLHRAFEARAKAMVALACQVVGCLVLVSCLVIGKAMQDERHHARLLFEHGVLADEIKAMESRMDQVHLVQEWLGGRAQLLDAITGMAQRTPSAVEWGTLTYTRDDQLALKGVSEEIPKVYDFAAELRSSGLFRTVEARRVAKRKVNDEDVTEFELVCALGPPGDADDGEASTDR
jgi:hypothetical protein